MRRRLQYEVAAEACVVTRRTRVVHPPFLARSMEHGGTTTSSSLPRRGVEVLPPLTTSRSRVAFDEGVPAISSSRSRIAFDECASRVRLSFAYRVR